MKYSCLILFLINVVVYGQSKDINYESERTRKDENKFPGALIFIKVNEQVYFEHEGIEVWCDMAHYYGEENFFKAYGNVRMKQGDTINMRSAYAEYNGNTKFAFASDKVVLTTPSNRLTTDSLFFDRNKQKSFYRSGGTVKDTASTITSIRGTYDMVKEKYAFRQNVVVTNPDYTIHTDFLDFYTENGHAYLYEPSTVETENGKVYCEKGFFDTRTNFGYFIKNSKVDYEQRTLYGDSIFFDQNRNFASATNNIKIIDTVNRTKVYGHYAEVYKQKDSIIITKNPWVASFQENDSIFIASDTMMITGKPEKRVVRAYPDARLYKSDLSGKADSIHSSQITGYTKMIDKPVLWSSNGQITGDTIMLISNLKTEKLDSLKVYNNSFMVQKDTIEGYNQVKGKELFGLFEDNKITEATFIKNAESLYYTRNDAGELIGIDKTLSSSLKMIFLDQEVTDIYYYNKASGDTYPETELPPNARVLKGMTWRGDELIESKADLFTNRPKYNLPVFKGIEDIETNDSIRKPFYEQKDLNIKSNLKTERKDSILKVKKRERLKVPVPVKQAIEQKND